MVAGAATRSSRRGSPATSASTTCSTVRATPRPAPAIGVGGDHVLRAAAGRRRQRHHRHPLPPVDQRHHRTRCACWSSSARRSPSSSPSGSASACSARTARRCCTAARPGASFRTAEGEFIEMHEPLGPHDALDPGPARADPPAASCRRPSTTTASAARLAPRLHAPAISRFDCRPRRSHARELAAATRPREPRPPTAHEALTPRTQLRRRAGEHGGTDLRCARAHRAHRRWSRRAYDGRRRPIQDRGSP